MKINLNINDIRQMVSECVEKILSEGISDITYHFTSLKSCVSILKDNEFHLTMSSNRSDAYNDKRLFYLSTQRGRNKELGYAGHLGSCVRIQLDGRKLKEQFKGMPVDYWGGEMGKRSYYRQENDSIYGRGFNRSRQTHHNFEMEDRIFSYDPVIANASNYILRVDVYIDPRTDRLNDTKVEKYRNELLQRIADEKDEAISIFCFANRHKVPVYIYNNLNDFNFMTNNVINNEIEQMYRNDFHSRTEMRYDDYDRYKMGKDFTNESKYIEILKNLFNVMTSGKIYNRSQESYKTISTTLKKFGLEKYTNAVIDAINHSWGNSYEESCGLLSNTINAPIKGLNSEIPNDDSNRIMRLGAYILRQKGVSNFDDCKRV